MRSQNAIILFARTPEVERSGGAGPFVALPWEDLDGVFHACAGDLLQAAASVPDTDILLYTDPRFPAERLPVPAGNGVRQFEMGPGEYGECVQQAVESAFLEYYHRVIVVLENNPLLGRGDFRAAADLLGVEDDCAVITPAEGGRVVLIALKANYPALFHGRGGGGPQGVLARLCELDVMIFPTPPSFTIDTTANIERLREELAGRNPGADDYPRRTASAFRALEKKYRWRKSGP